MSKRKYMRNPSNFQGGGQAKLEKQIAENRGKGGGCCLVVVLALGTVASTVGTAATWLA